MHFDWILTPVAIYGALAAGLCGCVYLFLSLNAELNALDRRFGRELGGLRAATDELLRKVAAEMDDRIAMLAPAALNDSVNLTKRTQALRMHRRGEAAEAIAAALGLTQSEVDLILKVQKIVLDSLEEGGVDGRLLSSAGADRPQPAVACPTDNSSDQAS